MCLRLGFPHPEYLYPYLSAGQLLDWQHFAEENGLGIDRDDIHWGMLMSMFFNVNRAEGTSAKPATDFMPYHKVDEAAEDAAFIERIRGMVRRA